MKRLSVALLLCAAMHAAAASDRELASRQPIITVAVAQPLVVPGDVAKNLANMEPLVAEAARRGAKVVVFSEM